MTSEIERHGKTRQRWNRMRNMSNGTRKIRREHKRRGMDDVGGGSVGGVRRILAAGMVLGGGNVLVPGRLLDKSPSTITLSPSLSVERLGRIASGREWTGTEIEEGRFSERGVAGEVGRFENNC